MDRSVFSDQVDATFAGFDTAANLDNVTAGNQFTVTWLVKNSGRSAWDGRFQFSHTLAPHSETDAFPRLPLPDKDAILFSERDLEAQPGETAAFTLQFTAPDVAGTYATNWQLHTPAGEPFGPICWLRVVVTPKPISAATRAISYDPDGWRDTIFKITSVFESGVPGGRPAAFQNEDAGIVSYGKHQATLQSGNLERVLQRYFELSDSPTSRALQQEFAPRVQQKDENLRHDGRFKQLLLEAAKEPAMSAAQDDIFTEKFYRPIARWAPKLGIQTALGLACLYDTHIQGGIDAVVTAVSQKLGVAAAGQAGPGGPVDENTWLRTFLDEREARLNRLADKRLTQNRPLEAKWLRTSIFRVTELRALLQAGNLNLAGEFTVRGQLIRGHAPGRERSEPAAPAKAEPAPVAAPAPNQYHGPPVTFLAGIHGPGDAHTWHDDGFRNMLKQLNMPVKFMSDADRFRWYPEFHKPGLNLVRVFWKPDPNRRKTAQQAWDEDIRDGVMNFYKQGARNFEVHNEPRLHHEGMGHQWHDGAQFGDFLRELMLIIKANCPGVQLWYPGESPGEPWTNQFAFSRPAYKKVSDLCDGLCMHAYAGETNDEKTAVAKIVGQVRDFHQAMGVWNKPIIVSECSVNRAATPEYRARVYANAARQMSQIPGVLGVFWYISHWNAPPAEKANAESWYGTDLPERYKKLMSA